MDPKKIMHVIFDYIMVTIALIMTVMTSIIFFQYLFSGTTPDLFKALSRFYILCVLLYSGNRRLLRFNYNDTKERPFEYIVAYWIIVTFGTALYITLFAPNKLTILTDLIDLTSWIGGILAINVVVRLTVNKWLADYNSAKTAKT